MDSFLFSDNFLFALCHYYLVERFELIATTGKNAKTQKIPFSRQPIFPDIVKVLRYYKNYSME
jgi:hypothetical protein